MKDLRELICVSRLTIRDSDEELDFGDEDGRLSRALQDLGLSSVDGSTSRGPLSLSRQSSAQSTRAQTLLGTWALYILSVRVTKQ